MRNEQKMKIKYEKFRKSHLKFFGTDTRKVHEIDLKLIQTLEGVTRHETYKTRENEN